MIREGGMVYINNNKNKVHNPAMGAIHVQVNQCYEDILMWLNDDPVTVK